MEKEIKTGMIMDAVSNNNENLKQENKDKVNEAVIDNQKMMQAYAQYKNTHTPKIKEHKIGRNDPCPCGSGKKYKNCCLNTGKYEKYINKK